jgi:hypothetical protein
MASPVANMDDFRLEPGADRGASLGSLETAASWMVVRRCTGRNVAKRTNMYHARSTKTTIVFRNLNQGINFFGG